VRLGTIIKDKYPELTTKIHVAVRQRALPTHSRHNKPRSVRTRIGDDARGRRPTRLVDGVLRFAMTCRENSTSTDRTASPVLRSLCDTRESYARGQA